MLPFPVCHWGGSQSPYFGGTNWLHRAALAGVVDGTSATISFHVHFPTNNDAILGLADGSNFGLAAVNLTAGKLFCFFTRASGGLGDYTIESTGVTLIEQVWHHVLLSFSGATAHLYIDGIDRLGATALHTDPLDFTADQFVVGAGAADGLASLDGCLQDVFVEFNKFTDFSDPDNRALYEPGVLSAGGGDVFLSGAPSAFETNQGSGGAFSRAGPAFTNCDNAVNS